MMWISEMASGAVDRVLDGAATVLRVFCAAGRVCATMGAWARWMLPRRRFTCRVALKSVRGRKRFVVVVGVRTGWRRGPARYLEYRRLVGIADRGAARSVALDVWQSGVPQSGARGAWRGAERLRRLVHHRITAIRMPTLRDEPLAKADLEAASEAISD